MGTSSDRPGRPVSAAPLARRAATQSPPSSGAWRRFFRRLLVVTEDTPPARITTDKVGSYAAAIARVSELGTVEHLQVRSALRCNNRVEQALQPTRTRERVMRRFKSAVSAQRFLDAFNRVCNLFRLRRHLLTAAVYRVTMRERAVTWREVAGLRAA